MENIKINIVLVLILMAFVSAFGQQSKQAKSTIIAQGKAIPPLSASDKISKSKLKSSACFTVTKLADGRVQFNSSDGGIPTWLFYNRTTQTTTAVASDLMNPRLGSMVAVQFTDAASTSYEVMVSRGATYELSCNCFMYNIACSNEFTYTVGLRIERIENVASRLEGEYRMVNTNSNKYLGLNNSNLFNGGSIAQFDANNNRSDLEWDFIPEADGRCRIRNMNSGRFLSVSGGSSNNGANMIQWQDNGQNDIYWRLINVGGSNYKIQNVNSKYYLGIRAGSGVTGAGAIQSADVGQRDIVWRIEPTSTQQTFDMRLFNAYLDCSFNTGLISINEGHYPILPANLPNDALSAIRSNQLRVAIYENGNFRGNCVVLPLGASVNCLTSYNFNDMTSSIIATRR